MTARTIDRSHPVMLDDGGMIRTTWGEFLDNNAEALGEAEVARIEADLLKRPGCTAFGGGGASGEWSIRLLIGFEGEGGGMFPNRTRQEANEIAEEADDDTLFP